MRRTHHTAFGEEPVRQTRPRIARNRANGIFLNSWTLIHKPVADYLGTDHAEQFAAKCLRPKIIWSIEWRRGQGAANSTLSVPGHGNLARLRDTLQNGFGLELSELQIGLHEDCIAMCLPSIYHNEWKREYLSILKQFNLQRRYQELLMVTPRRFGKTVGVSAFAAGYMMCIPKAEVAIYSTGKRMAGKLMLLCLSFMRKLPGFESHVVTRNMETIVMDFGENDKRTLCCYPGSVAVRTFSCHSPLLSPSLFATLGTIERK